MIDSADIGADEIKNLNRDIIDEHTYDRCGNSAFKEKMIYVDRNISHHSNSVKFFIVTDLNGGATDESWGFKEFSLTIDRCHSTCKDCSGPMKH